jgi:hypothetical protein
MIYDYRNKTGEKMNPSIFDYLLSLNRLPPEPERMRLVREEAARLNIPAVRPETASILYLFALLKKPSRVLEIGTGSGFGPVAEPCRARRRNRHARTRPQTIRARDEKSRRRRERRLCGCLRLARRQPRRAVRPRFSRRPETRLCPVSRSSPRGHGSRRRPRRR